LLFALIIAFSISTVAPVSSAALPSRIFSHVKKKLDSTMLP